MTARILDGRPMAKQIRTELGDAVKARVASGLRRPGLAVVLVGSDPTSEIYVRSKCRDCQVAGFRSRDIDLPSSTTQAELCAAHEPGMS